MRLKFLASLFLLSLFPVGAFALPGEAAAVIAHCGTPLSDTMSTSEVNNLPQRTLTYPGMRLNFEPAGYGWSFTTGWHSHLPENQNEVSARMPCFAAALAAVAATPAQPIDPSMANQIGPATTTNRANFGIANLWLLLFLAGVIILFGVLFPRARQVFVGPKLTDRPYQKPGLPVMARFRRRPRVRDPKDPLDRL